MKTRLKRIEDDAAADKLVTASARAEYVAHLELMLATNTDRAAKLRDARQKIDELRAKVALLEAEVEALKPPRVEGPLRPLEQ